MFNACVTAFALTTAAMVTAAVCNPGVARADHTCDPVEDAGWRVVASHETGGQVDSAPFQAGAGGNWFVNRTATVVPFCNYYNEIGIYSMRSYTLAPQRKEERIAICRATGQGGSVAVAPYVGPCPPM